MFDPRCSGNKTNAPDQLRAGSELLSDLQPLHKALGAEVHFVPLLSAFQRTWQANELRHLFMCVLWLFLAV